VGVGSGRQKIGARHVRRQATRRGACLGRRAPGLRFQLAHRLRPFAPQHEAAPRARATAMGRRAHRPDSRARRLPKLERAVHSEDSQPIPSRDAADRLRAAARPSGAIQP
jgi:hypothetical protein